MNIGMILDQQFPVDLRVEHEASVLMDAGNDVFLFCLDYTGKQPLEEVAAGLQVKRKRYPKWVNKISALAYTFPLYHLILKRAIKKFIEQNNIEAIHVHDIPPARAVFQINKTLQLPLILDLHENRPEIMKYYGHLQRFPGKYLIQPSRWKKYEYKYIRKSTRVVVVTQEAKAHYVEQVKVDPDHIIVAPNTVTRSFYENYEIDEEIIARYKDSFMLLYIGDTGERRGLETILEAIPRIKDQAPDLKFCILGEGINNMNLKVLTERLRITEFVDFEGWKPPRLFHSYILASKVCTCPILRNQHHDTTYANKLFQYAALGVPQLVSDCPSQKNLVESYDIGLAFEANNPASCAARIMEFYLHREKLKIQGNNARQAIRTKLRAEIVAKDLVRLYQELNQ